MRDRLPPLRRELAPAAAVVAERIVALAHRLPEPGLLRTRDEVEAFLRVACDAVEESAEQSRLTETEMLRGLIAEQLQHDQLVQREARHAPRQGGGVFEQSIVGDRFQDEA